jgi:hypothetical protein
MRAMMAARAGSPVAVTARGRDADRKAVTNSGDTQVLARIPVPGAPAGPLPTVALTLAATEPDTTQEFASVRAAQARVEPVEEPEAPVAESHDAIYEEAMATIAALASNWSSAVSRTGRHRAAA